jgi:hypothetical protein
MRKWNIAVLVLTVFALALLSFLLGYAHALAASRPTPCGGVAPVSIVRSGERRPGPVPLAETAVNIHTGFLYR